MSGCESIQSWFEAEFNRRYRDAKAGADDATVAILDKCRAKTMTGLDNLQAWSRGVLTGKIPGNNGGGDFRVAIFETIDWVAFQSKLEVLDDDDEEEEEEEEEEEICYSCEETKIDKWYYNLIPKKNTPVCTACRDREETCDCCNMKYPYYQIKHDGGGKYVCITCDNECPCHDCKCGTVCPAITKIIDGLANNSSASAQPTVKVKPIVSVNFRRALEMEDLYNAEQKRIEEMRESGVPI